MLDQRASLRADATPTIGDLLAALVAELLEAEGETGLDPLVERLSLAAVWDDLCRLAGEPLPAFVRNHLADAASPVDSGVSSPTTGGPVNDLCGQLLAELAIAGVPRPLCQRFALGFLWADLCRLAGEPVSAAVGALLDTPAVAERGAGRAG